MTTADVLRAVLETVRRDGWSPTGWAIVPPWTLRYTISQIVAKHYQAGGQRDKANAAARKAVSDALGQPLGLITSWETKPGRTQAQVEALLEKAIAGCQA